MSEQKATVLLAGAVRDAEGVDARPGAVLVECGKVVAAGPPESLCSRPLAGVTWIERLGKLVLPAMVNSHTHLELTKIGPQPYDPAGGFVGWVKMLRSFMPKTLFSIPSFESKWFSSGTRWGGARAKSAGVQAVGDIGRWPTVAQARRSVWLAGVTYIEGFGIGPPGDQSAMREVVRGRDGLQPHAPYSAGPALYEAAARSGRPVSTHLAETLDELTFVAEGRGSNLDFLKELGVWRDPWSEYYGQGLSPVQWMRPHLEAAAPDGGWLVAHCNYVSDEDIRILGDTNTSVAYCPIASEYFGHTDHRYRDMLEAGVNVCLGTDSIVCARPDDPQPLGLLSAMRRLYERDAADPDTLLRLATVNGARALRMPGTTATLQPGAPAKFALIDIDKDNDEDVLRQAMMSDALIERLDLT